MQQTVIEGIDLVCMALECSREPQTAMDSMHVCFLYPHRGKSAHRTGGILQVSVRRAGSIPPVSHLCTDVEPGS